MIMVQMDKTNNKWEKLANYNRVQAATLRPCDNLQSDWLYSLLLYMAKGVAWQAHPQAVAH